ncbi:MAG: hypothetical protein ACPG49_08630 [Chitinophagales bacterium]
MNRLLVAVCFSFRQELKYLEAIEQNTKNMQLTFETSTRFAVLILRGRQREDFNKLG